MTKTEIESTTADVEEVPTPKKKPGRKKKAAVGYDAAAPEQEQLSLRGKTLSLDLSKATYYGGDSFWMGPENPVLEVPENISDSDHKLLVAGFFNGVLQEGKKWLPPIQRDPAVLKKYLATLTRKREALRFDKEETNLWQALINKGLAGGYTSKEIIRECLKVEKGGAARPAILKTLEGMLASDRGPDTIAAPPDVFQES